MAKVPPWARLFLRRAASIAAAVGVDIGCGMIAVKTTLSAGQLPDNLDRMEAGIERRIPLGAGAKNTKITSTAQECIGKLTSQAAGIDYRTFSGWQEQLGTLGSGSHFVEVCLDEAEQVWLVLHSGSRGVGNRIASHHIKIAQKLMDLGKVPLKDRGLGYLPEQTPELETIFAICCGRRTMLLRTAKR